MLRGPKSYPGGPLSTTHWSRIRFIALVFTRHARKRILERGIRVDEIHQATESPTVVEECPDDEPYPSRLVMGWAGGRPLHVVLAGPTVTGDTIVVTLYEPGPETVGAGLCQENAEAMKCALCRTGETKPGTTTETYEIGGAVIVVRGVPAEVCQQCGEAYTDEDTTRQLEKIVAKARRAGVVVIQEYQSA
jgi:YgiT-type zinc finger domain-containing protein